MPSPAAGRLSRGSTPVHLRPGLVALVALGGAVGTGVRYGIAQLLPAQAGWPWATFTVNLVGAFALGLLLEALVRRGPEDAVARRWRLGLGTGVLGGLTTFSALALELERMLTGGELPMAAAYAGASLLGGVGLATAGVLVAAKAAR